MDTKKGIPHKSIFTTWDIYDLRGTIVDDSLVYFKVYLTDTSTPELQPGDTATISLNAERNFFIYDSKLF